MDWPPWQGQEVARLRELYGKPSVLHAAIDDQKDAVNLTESLFPGVPESALYGKPSVLHAAIDDQKDAVNLTESLFPGVPESAVKARADALFEWFMRSERAAKVARRETLTHMWETLPGEHEPRDLPAQFDETTKQNPLVLLEGLARRKRALKSDADPSRRAEEERQAREKYAALLSGVITKAKLPVVEYLSGVSDSDAVWARLFGTRRSRTLRNRYKSWDTYSKWLETTYGKTWPTKLAHILDYAAERYNEGCGKTVLDSFQASLSVLEQAGRVPEAQMLSRDPTWLAQLASMTADLTSQQPPVKQAPMLTVAIILSLELYILDKESPPYFRGLAWAEAGASLATMYKVTQVHQTRRRFQAIADTRAQAREAAKADFGVENDTPEGRAQTASVVAAWELAKEYSAKETELKAEAKVLGQKRILQTQERQAMLKAVMDVYGKLNEGECPSADYLAAKAEETEVNEPTASSLDRISSKRDNQVESLRSLNCPTTLSHTVG
eukprot:s9630_g2.t1